MESKDLICRVYMIVQGVLGTSHRLFLIGSRASGDARATSDYDFGLLGEGPVPFDKYLEIKAKLGEVETLHGIDIVDLTAASKDFREVAERDMKEVIDGQV